MKNFKLSLSDIEGKLTRQQMRKILGGCGSGGHITCNTEIPETNCPDGYRCYGSSYVCCLSSKDPHGNVCAEAVEKSLG